MHKNRTILHNPFSMGRILLLFRHTPNLRRSVNQIFQNFNDGNFVPLRSRFDSQCNFLSGFIGDSLGRILFGTGFESSFISQALMAEKWFSGGMLTVMMGLNRAFAYVMASLATFTLPPLFFGTRGLQIPFFLCAGVCFLGCVTAGILTWLDMVNDKHIDRGDEENKENLKQKFKLKDIKHIPALAWFLVGVQSFFSQCYLQLTNFATDLIVQRFGFEYIEAKNVSAFIPLASMIFVPAFSAYFGAKGKKSLGLLSATLVAVATFATMAFLPADAGNLAYIGVLGSSCFWSIYSSCSSINFSYLSTNFR